MHVPQHHCIFCSVKICSTEVKTSWRAMKNVSPKLCGSSRIAPCLRCKEGQATRQNLRCGRSGKLSSSVGKPWNMLQRRWSWQQQLTHWEFDRSTLSEDIAFGMDNRRSWRMTKILLAASWGELLTVCCFLLVRSKQRHWRKVKERNGLQILNLRLFGTLWRKKEIHLIYHDW